MKLALVQMADVRDIKPPLGLATIATYLDKYMGFKDAKIIDPTLGNIKEMLLRAKPDIVGISSMTFEYGDAINLAGFVKKELDVPVMIGGVHISTLPNSLHKNFNLGIVGEGEETTLELMQLFKKKGGFNKDELKKIDGLVFYNKNKLVQTKRRALIEPLDKIPIPNRKFINPEYFKKHYTISLAKPVKEATMLTSRGCPYRCVFCATSTFWRNSVRFHSAKHVFEEIRTVTEEYEVKHFDVWDDLFTINKQRLKELAKLMKENGFKDKVTISCQARTNLVNDELCRLLKDINVKSVSMGLESGSEKVLSFLKGKGITVEDNKRAIVMLKKHGFRVLGSLIFGSPGETIDDMKKTIKLIDFAIKHKANTLYSYVMTPFPGTRIWEIAKQRGKVSDNMWNKASHLAADNPFSMENEAKTYENPLLLDDSISKNEFKKVFFEARKHLNTFRYRFIMDSIRQSPIDTAKYILSNPRNTLKSVIGILKGNR